MGPMNELVHIVISYLVRLIGPMIKDAEAISGRKKMRQCVRRVRLTFTMEQLRKSSTDIAITANIALGRTKNSSFRVIRRDGMLRVYRQELQSSCE